MISIREASFLDKKKIAKEMHLDGYISSTALSGMHYTQIDALGIDSKKLDSPKLLKKKFEEDNNLRCICLDYGRYNKKYWYSIADLRKIYG